MKNQNINKKTSELIKFFVIVVVILAIFSFGFYSLIPEYEKNDILTNYINENYSEMIEYNGFENIKFKSFYNTYTIKILKPDNQSFIVYSTEIDKTVVSFEQITSQIDSRMSTLKSWAE